MYEVPGTYQPTLSTPSSSRVRYNADETDRCVAGSLLRARRARNENKATTIAVREAVASLAVEVDA